MLNEVLGLTKPEPIDVGPAIVEDEYESISVGPAIVNPEINNSPLVQIVINVKPGSGNPVVVEGMPEVAPTPVIVVENPVAPDPVIVAPVIIPEPVITLPDILN
nr:36.4 kDa proline-rich protein-like [Vanessa tameamea]